MITLKTKYRTDFNVIRHFIVGLSLLSSTFLLFACKENNVQDFSCENLDTVTVYEDSNKKYQLTSPQKCILSQLLLKRKDGYDTSKRNLSYYVIINVKSSQSSSGTVLEYDTDGMYFQGVDQTTCQPFAFTLEESLFSRIRE